MHSNPLYRENIDKELQTFTSSLRKKYCILMLYTAKATTD